MSAKSAAFFEAPRVFTALASAAQAAGDRQRARAAVARATAERDALVSALGRASPESGRLVEERWCRELARLRAALLP